MPRDDKRSLPCIYVRGFKSLAHLLNDGQAGLDRRGGPSALLTMHDRRKEPESRDKTAEPSSPGIG